MVCKAVGDDGDLFSDPREILIGVDFGTTFSGLAWAQTARPDVQTTIIQWPNVYGSLEGETSEKVPTQLCYRDNEINWGFGIPDHEARYQWFKLGLDPAQRNNEVSLLAVDYPDPKAMPPAYENERNPAKLTTDYLAQLRKHAVNILRRKLGDTIIDTTPIRYTITVPAIWSDAAKTKTLSCASVAGMGKNIRIVSEPEAAVVHALDAMSPHDLKIGDKFVLCDAGGGTVDLITYQIEALDPIVKVREAVPGSGSACGSTFLNRIFRKYLEESLGHLDGFGDDTLEDALAEFENLTKRRFTGDEDTVAIRVPGLMDNAEKGIKRQKLTMKGTALKDLFKPVMTAITTLVKSQLQQSKTARAIILVGGFGQSAYLRNCIQQVVGEGIEIMQPAYGWTAVVRGALLKALHESSPELSRIDIASRQARRAYGMDFETEYDVEKHVAGPRRWDSFSGHYMAAEMKWFVNKGDDLDQREPLTTNWVTSQQVAAGPFRSYYIDIFVFDPKGNEASPKFPCKEVKKTLRLTADLSTIPSSRYPVKIGEDGNKHYEMAFEVKVAFFSAHMEFSLWYQGTEYGKVNAEFSADSES